jgi:hypothetical protein
MIKLPEKMLRDEAEMRAFYLSVGISPETTEAAIRARRTQPGAEEAKPPASKSKKRKAAAAPK